MMAKQIDELIKFYNSLDDYPLTPDHICFDKGHNMYSMYKFKNSESNWGTHKCSRCGYTEDWQYDH